MLNPNKEASKGDILAEKDVTDSHYIVYLAPYDKNEDVFIGAMLTHSLINGNIALQKDHFTSSDENGPEYKVTFDESFVANHPVFKKIEGASFEKVGQLTEKGIRFIEDSIAPYVYQFIP
jgi:hypothetical protein